MAAVAGGNAAISEDMMEMARAAAKKAGQIDDFNRNTPDYGLWPQVMKAAWEGKVEELEQLLTEDPTCIGGTPDGSSGLTPLHVACHYDQEASAEVLLSKGADINADDGAGWTPLHHAAYDGYHIIVRFLVRCARTDKTYASTFTDVRVPRARSSSVAQTPLRRSVWVSSTHIRRACLPNVGASRAITWQLPSCAELRRRR